MAVLVTLQKGTLHLLLSVSALTLEGEAEKPSLSRFANEPKHNIPSFFFLVEL
jgi:hypothetical protein